MSTALEVDFLDDLFDIIEQSNQVLAERGAQRTLTTIQHRLPFGQGDLTGDLPLDLEGDF